MFFGKPSEGQGLFCKLFPTRPGGPLRTHIDSDVIKQLKALDIDILEAF